MRVKLLLGRLLLASGVLTTGFAPCIAQDGAGISISLDGAAGLGDATPAKVKARFATATEDRPAVLAVTVTLDAGWHCYSVTQPRGGPQATKITLSKSEGVRLAGKFTPDAPPKKHIDDLVWKGLELQEHSRRITWFAPLELPADDAESLKLKGEIALQVCSDSCIPLKLKFTATHDPKCAKRLPREFPEFEAADGDKPDRAAR
jgi:DsbC/DsbD-like thiol-disulfide interchange protein